MVSRCVCNALPNATAGRKRMLVAGHIKPWKDSTSAERMDLRNGLAACPSHDVAFNTGLRNAILLPDQAQRPGRKYLDWRRANVFAG